MKEEKRAAVAVFDGFLDTLIELAEKLCLATEGGLDFEATTAFRAR